MPLSGLVENSPDRNIYVEVILTFVAKFFATSPYNSSIESYIICLLRPDLSEEEKKARAEAREAKEKAEAEEEKKKEDEE